MDDLDKLAERDKALARIIAALEELDETIRVMVIDSPHPRVRVDLRRLMLELHEVRASARHCFSWWYEGHVPERAP